MDPNNPDTWLQNIGPQPRTQQPIKNNADNSLANLKNGTIKVGGKEVSVCKISGTVIDKQTPIREYDTSLNVILNGGRVVNGEIKEMASLWIGGNSDPIKDYLSTPINIGDPFSAIITEYNDLVVNEKHIKNYPNVPECNLATVQAQSLKLFPDLAKWDIEALDAKVLGTQSASQKGKFADYCQLNETVLATKSSFLKNGKGITTAFIFQNDEGDIFTAREQISFAVKKNTSLLTSFDTVYKDLHGKKLHVVIDRNNKNTILSQYTAADKNLPWCVPQNTQENNVFPIAGNISGGGGGIFLAFLMILAILLLGIFAKKAKSVTFENI